MGVTLRPHPQKEIGAASRAVRRAGTAGGWKAGSTALMLLAAGALVPPWPLAGGSGARDWRDGTGSAPVSRIRKANRGVSRRRGVHDSDRARRQALPARPDLHAG